MLFSEAQAAGSLLRVACDGADVGAEITINGVFKGECPLDIQVNPGSIQLRVVKRVDASRERVFEQEFRMGDGVVKKVDAVLSAPQLNAAAKRRVEAEFAALRQAAEAGDAKAMFSLAYRYEQGQGVAQSDALANDWYRKAADAGNSDAMTNLGFRHKFGKGVPPDGEAAVTWYRRAAEAGNPTAMNNLAAEYLNGKSVPRDVAEAIRWFEQSAAAGYVEAATNLAFNYASGTVLPKNDALALEWYRKAADGGSARAMYGLGTLYANGRGVARDGEEAVRWYRAAAAKSYSPAIEELKKRGLQ
ncbi:MAG: tetratricopeptide repeat protein [Rhodospirillaceae bacterium]